MVAVGLSPLQHGGGTYLVLAGLNTLVPSLVIRPVVGLWLLLMEKPWFESVVCLLLGTTLVASHGQGLE